MARTETVPLEAIVACFCASRLQLAPGFLALEDSRKLSAFVDCQLLIRVALDTPVKFFGLAARCSSQRLEILFLHLDFFDTDNFPAQKKSPTFESCTLVRMAVGEQ